MSQKLDATVAFNGDTKISDEPVEVLVKANMLEYNKPKSLSVMKQRRLIRHNSTLQSYTAGQTMSIQFNNSDDLIAAGSSVLYFSIYTDQAAHFGKGSGLNLFEESTLVHRTGVEINREVKKNVYMRNMIYWEKDPDWIAKNGDLMMLNKKDSTVARTELKAFYDQVNVASTAAAQLTAYDVYAKTTRAALDVFALAGAVSAEASASSTTVFAAVQAYLDTQDLHFEDSMYESVSVSSIAPTRIGIPLSMVNGFFATNKMIPAFLTSGLKLNLKLDTAMNAFISKVVGSPVTTYSVSNVYIAADSFLTNDQMIQELEDRSSSGDLVFSFPAYHSVPKTISSTALHMTAEHATAVTLMGSVVHRQTVQLNNDAFDSLATEGAAAVSSFQYRLGSQYYPPNQITDSKEYYHWTLSAMGKLGMPSIDYTAFLGTDLTTVTKWGEWTQAIGHSVIPVSLERSNILNLSGLPVSGLQALALDATFTTSQNRQIDLFINHVKIVKPYLYSKLLIRQ